MPMELTYTSSAIYKRRGIELYVYIRESIQLILYTVLPKVR